MKQVFKEGRFRSKRVVSGVSGQDTVVRYLSMPNMSDSELQQAIQFEADKIVASDEDFILDCVPLQRQFDDRACPCSSPPASPSASTARPR